MLAFLPKARPTTPVLLTAGTTYGDHWFRPSGNDEKRAALQAQYNEIVRLGIKNVHLFLNTHDELFASNELINPTVGKLLFFSRWDFKHAALIPPPHLFATGGTHPSDLGHREIANFYTSFLPQFFQDE